MNAKEFFTKRLLRWDRTDNYRPMPWKGEKDPYKIWLSEIILQQTRVDQGREYYDRFVKTFPSVQQLAAAPETKIFKLWEGLGYYNRCKNMIATAKFIVKERKGKFPDTYEGLLALKGIGPYTAAAIASFAYQLPYAVIDGNVIRVLARYFGIDAVTDNSEGRKVFAGLAGELLDVKQPGIYNQAIMDFGAMCCKPKSPLCISCPLKINCTAYLKGKVELLPVKGRPPAKKKRWFYYLVVEHNGKVYVRKRAPMDIWENLYEFILAETTVPCPIEKLKLFTPFKKIIEKNNISITSISEPFVQQLTHQTIRGQFVRASSKTPLDIRGYDAVSGKRLKTLPFPRLIAAYLSENMQ